MYKIYLLLDPVLLLPAVFVIGNNGKPIHILTGQNIKAEETVEKLKDAVEVSKLSLYKLWLT